MITYKTYTAPIGLSILPSSDLAYKRVLAVHREGVENDLVSGTPSGRQVRHIVSTGFLRFDSALPFMGDIFGDRSLSETINVIYET